ncbi:MAG: hypothetical protein ACFFAH_13875 [Promethearchaeota archaeon]
MLSPDNKQIRPLILDIGSSTFRLGWAGEDSPDIVAPSVYVDVTDYIFDSDVIDGLDELFFEEEKEKLLYGLEALKNQNILKVHEFKKENNYNIFSKFFHYYYQKLNISSENQYKQSIIIITPFFTSELEKTKFEQIFFQLNFPYLLFLSESQAILQTLQKTTGVVVNMGESKTYFSTIFHGFTNIMARDMFPIAGKDLTNHFLNMILTRKDSEENFYLDKWLAKEIKDKSSICVLDVEAERNSIKEGLTNYDQEIKFPDGTSLKIDEERFMLSEPLFNPRLMHIDYFGLDEAIAKVIKSWERENWEELLPNIILSGGGSLIPGLKERLKLELTKHFSDKIRDKINVLAVSGRENMSWIGASILYSKKKLQEGWKPNPEYKG